MSVKKSRVYWNVCRWFQGILKCLSIISVCTENSEGVMKLLINDRRVYWNSVKGPYRKFWYWNWWGILKFPSKMPEYTGKSDQWSKTLLVSFWSRVYWNDHQRFLGRLKIHTEISVKVSKVYWKFRGYTQISEQSTEISVDDFGVYWIFLSMLKGILIMTTRAPQAKNSVYLGYTEIF